MADVRKFEVVHHCETGTLCGSVIHVDYGGDVLELPVDGRIVLVEMSKWFGPIPLNKKTHDELRRIPRGFWQAYEKWVNGGMLVSGVRCVFSKEAKA